MIPDPTPPEVKHYKERTSRKAFLMRGRHLKTVLKGDIPPKEVATKEGPFGGDSALGVIDPRS